MNLVFKQSEFEHDVNRSSYNNNYYRHKKLKYTVYEVCHEDYDFQEFYLIEENEEKKIFLGCSQEGFGDGEYVTVEFKEYYT